MSVRAERHRLSRAFQAALLAVGSPAILFACSSSRVASGVASSDGGPGSSTDATLAADAFEAGATDAADDSDDAQVAADAALPPSQPEAGPVGNCFAGSYELDSGPDADGAAEQCAYLYPCGLAGTALGVSGCQVLDMLPDGALVPLPQMTCWLPQGGGCDNDAYAPGEGGLTIICSPCPTAAGRRPAGLRRPREARGGTLLGAYLASMAFEEEAAVAAFDRMGAELAALGAPPELVSEAARASRDEMRHVRAMARLARADRRDGRLTRARVRRVPRRSAAAVAAENAAEGCVRETYGALVAHWQSLHAGDAELRRAFSRIAADEARHAALSWAVAKWIEPRLDAKGRERADRSRRQALEALRTAAEVEPPAELVRSAGLPAASQALALLRALSRELALA